MWAVLVTGLFCLLGGMASGADKYHRYCYLDTMAQLRQGAGRFSLADLDDVTLCTHLVFMHAEVDPYNLDLAPALQDDFDYYYHEVTDLKKDHPDLMVLLLVGGPGGQTSSLADVSKAFSTVVNDTESMETFVGNTLAYLRYFAFDGVELDWRYPGYFGSLADDVYRFTVLVRKLSEKFDLEVAGSNTPRLLLNVRVSGDRYLLTDSVQVDEIIRYADYLVVTAYDFYVAEGIIGHNSGLYGRNDDSNIYAVLNADYIVQYLVQYTGVPASKVVLGMPTFGRTSLFINETLQAFGAPHNGSGPSGPYTEQPGLLAYYEICSLLSNGWSEILDSEQLTPFAFSNEEIVTYDNIESITTKANYIKDNGLAGAALWDLSYDDFSGVFCDHGRFPLANALRSTLTASRSTCNPGHRGHLDVAGCVPCPLGTFQPSEGTMACIPCPQGLTTLLPARSEQYDCILPCPSGSEYNYVTLSCDACPLGYFRKADRDPACLKCPPGFTTIAKNSKGCVRRPAGVPEILPRQMDVKATLTFTTKSCENKPVIIGAVGALVADYFRRLAHIWDGLCDVPACNNVISDVIQGCEGGEGGKDIVTRRKRQAEEKLVVSILVANVSEELNSTESTRRTQSVIASALHERKEFEPLSTYGILFARIESLETHVVCEMGSAPNDGYCEPCEAGSYHNLTSSTCEPCPAGQYQHLEGQAGCWPCPGVMTTMLTGASSPDHCVSPCQARPNFCFNEGVCHWTEADQGTVYCECKHEYQGERCSTIPAASSGNGTGTLVGAIVGGVLAFLLVVLLIIAFCVCFRVRKAVKLRHIDEQRGSSVRSNNHYMTWGTFSKGSTGRGVKFVDYIDYYMWLSNLSDQQAQAAYSFRKSKTATTREPSPAPKTMMTSAPPQPTAASIDHTNNNGIAETNIDAMERADHN